MKMRILVMLMLSLLVISGCSSPSSEEAETEASSDSEMVTYESENGPVDVPKNPERVVLLSGFTGNVLHLDVPIVGVDQWSMDNPTYADGLENAEVVSEDNLEKIIELEPDLIITLSTTKNIDQLSEIAPTVSYTWGKLDYLEQHIEIGKLLNKEEEARAWVEDFEERAASLGEEIRSEIGEDTTVSVIESFGKELYVFGDNWARGTEILYQAMELEMPEKVEEMALEEGYHMISAEVIPEYAGDYLVVSQYSDSETSFQETEAYQNIPAVKNGNVIEMDGEGASFSDPLTLEKHLKLFEESFLGDS